MDYKTHASCCSEPLCGSRSITAHVNQSTCQKCIDAMDKIVLFILAVADGKAGEKEANKLIQKFGFTRDD